MNLPNKILKQPYLFLCVVMLLFSIYQAAATTINVTSNTNWSSLSATSSDIIVIGNNATLTVNVTNAVCGSIQIGDGVNPGILTFAASGSPSLVVTKAGGQDGTVTCGDGGNSSGNDVLMVNDATLTVADMNDNSGAWDMDAGTVNIINSGTAYPATATYHNLNILGGGTAYYGNLNSITGTLYVGGGCTLFSYGGRWTGSGTLTGYGTIKIYLSGYTNDLIRTFGMSTLDLSNMAIDFEGGETVPSDLICRSIILNSDVNFTGNVTVADTLTINTGTTLTPAATSAILVSGMIISPGSITVTAAGNNDDFGYQYSGTMDLTGGTIIYAGASAQKLGPFTLNNFKVNNAAGVTLSGDVTVNGIMTLQAGKITLGTNKLTIGSSGNITGYCSTRFVETNSSGVLEMLANHTGGTVFPVGDGFNPITITPTSDAVFDVGVANGITDYNASPLTTNAANVTWTIQLTSGSQNVIVTPQWNGSDELPSFSRGNSVVAYRTDQVSGNPGSAWVPTTGFGSASGSDPYTRTSGSINMSTGNSYYIGVGDNISPLPVTLISFTAIPENNHVNLNWSTVSEINNDYFDIERSVDGQAWQSIGHIPGHGNSISTKNYMDVDDLSGIVPSGTIYYRLNQVDFNGENTYSMIRAVNLGGMNSSISLYPNPANDILNISWKNETGGSATFKLINSIGSMIYSENIEGNANMKKQIDISAYPAGTYFIQISTDKYINSQVVYKVE